MGKTRLLVVLDDSLLERLDTEWAALEYSTAIGLLLKFALNVYETLDKGRKRHRVRNHTALAFMAETSYVVGAPQSSFLMTRL